MQNRSITKALTMLVITVFVATTLFVVASSVCYLRRFLFFQDIEGAKAGFPWPLVMDAFEFRNAQKAAECALEFPKKIGYKLRSYKFSIGFDSYLVLHRNEDIQTVMNLKELISKGKDYRFAKTFTGDGLLVSTGTKWTERRKLLTPSFHSSILRDFVPTFEANGDVLIELLHQKSNKTPIKFSKIFSLYSLDVICETTMGVPIDAQRNENHEYVVLIKELVDLLLKRALSWWKRSEFLYKFSGEHKKYRSMCERCHNYTYNIINQRKQTLSCLDNELSDQKAGRNKFALLDMLIKGTINGISLSNEEIREEVDTFMFEGHDTTSSALSFSLYCLSQHPDIQEKLFVEQKNILGECAKAVHATYDDLQKMDYLEMFIKEVLRLYPSVPGISREVKENISMDFGTLRKDLQVAISPLALHRNPEYFPDPEKFDPERFSKENINNIKPFTFIPFSAGFRNCIGKRFAMLSLKSTISKIVRNFIIHPDVTFKPILCFDIILKSQNGIWAIIEKRI